MKDPYLDDAPEARFQLEFLRRLWPFVRPYRRGFAGCLLLLSISFVLELLAPWLVRLAIDGPMRDASATDAERIRELLWIAAGFLATTAGGAGLGYVYGMWTAWNGQRVVRDVRSHLFRHLMRTGLGFHERNPAGKLTTRVTSDVDNLNELISTGVLQSVFDLMKILGVVVVLFWLDNSLAVFTIATTPVLLLISLLFRRNAERAYRAVRGRLALQNAFATELIGGIRTTRAYGREATVADLYARRNHDTASSWRTTVWHFSVFFSLIDLALRLTTVGLLWFGGTAVLEGTLSPGQFVQFWICYGLLTSPIKQLGEKYNVLQAAFASCERVFQILDEPEFPPGGGNSRPSPRRGAADIAFDAVTFEYVAGTPVLDRISFRAAAGQTVAIVGPTGSGKSTLLSLVSRLREPQSGVVRVDGDDVRGLELTSLRRRIAFVAQDLYLFTGTILDNVRLFDPAIDEQRVTAALQTVGALDFVQRLPDGLLTAVEERGATLSQGERQLIAFARALVHDPDVLLLDEATASIDSEAEHRLQRALAAALRGRTALVVAHRLSTVRQADLILVLEHGRITESGNHDQLVAQNGVYARMLSHVQDRA
ncbi:MAG: ABC transporter ATP-binding protein [Planctomycetes bacterium]|nr:ABC transporter ATP-binding protein [Planctomycetota bacterium]